MNLLLPVLRGTLEPTQLTMAQWDLLLRQARHTNLLARLAHFWTDAGLMPQLPLAVQAHLVAALALAQAQMREVQREVSLLADLLAPLHTPALLLKGAAYVMSGQPSAAGRTFSDIDVLVPRTQLAEVERRLMLAGWITTHHNAYDQRYYRQWMHELPPMVHFRRGTALDVHHAIMPLTARLRPDAERLRAAAVAVPGHPNVQVLCDEDMILHSMTHLLHNDDMSHGLRDLTDLDLLLRAKGEEPGFWGRLQNRALELTLQRPLHHGLWAVSDLLGTPVPAEVRAQAADLGAPGAAAQRLMQTLWRRGLGCQHHSAALPGTALALGALYVRAHWLRMPAPLLTRHLATKAWRRVFESEKIQPTTA